MPGPLLPDAPHVSITGSASETYRALVAPLARYIDALRSQRAGLTVTVILPELIVERHGHRPLHNGTAQRLRRVLRRRPGIVITTVPHHVAT